jgi:UDP-glucose 4-epimerase
MNCVILGGGGFLGYHLCQALLTAGHRVRIFDRPNLERFSLLDSSGSVEWIEGDFVNQGDLEPAISGCDIIYHLVSTTLPKSSNENPLYDIETNVIGTLRLLDLVKGKNKKIIFISSGGTVYGIPEEVPIKESHPTNPICSYGIGKVTIEKYLHLYHHLYNLDYCVFRLANPFGERQKVAAAQGVIAVFLHKALHDQPIEIWGDGTVIRDYLYVKDAIAPVVKAITYRVDCRIFNVGSGEGKSLNEVLAAIGALLGKEVRCTFTPSRAFDVPSNVLDISLAARYLDWYPRTTYQDGLSRTLAWIVNHEMR